MAVRDSYRRSAAVTTSDTVDIATGITVGLVVKTAGDYKLILADDSAEIAVNLAAGVVHPLRVKRVFTTGAAATTGVVALY